MAQCIPSHDFQDAYCTINQCLWSNASGSYVPAYRVTIVEGTEVSSYFPEYTLPSYSRFICVRRWFSVTHSRLSLPSKLLLDICLSLVPRGCLFAFHLVVVSVTCDGRIVLSSKGVVSNQLSSPLFSLSSSEGSGGRNQRGWKKLYITRLISTRAPSKRQKRASFLASGSKARVDQ